MSGRNVRVELGCRVKGNYPHIGSGPTGGVHSVGGLSEES